jgi:hypothetical protein
VREGAARLQEGVIVISTPTMALVEQLSETMEDAPGGAG